jgi:hypothetical protein
MDRDEHAVASRSDQLDHESRSWLGWMRNALPIHRGTPPPEPRREPSGQAVRLLDDWPADTERTGTALAKLIGGSPTYARELVVRYIQERRPAPILELVKN